MIHLIYEEMDDQISNMIMKRLCREDKRDPIAEQELKDWFASKGIDLEIIGWEDYLKKDLNNG